MRHARTVDPRPVLQAVIWVVVVALSAGPGAASDDTGYGFYRTIEGNVRLTTLDRAEPLDVEPNYPLLLGDRIWVSPGGRLEALLPDQTILRAGGGTDLYFEELALYAGETAGTGSVLRLLEGEIQVVVSGYLNEEPIRIDTPNATLYLQEPGTYRIYADKRQWTELVVREGFGEVALADGSVVVRGNEEAVIDGEFDPRVRVYAAGALDSLEAWGAELDREAQLVAHEPYVDESLRYQSAPLRRHGEWIAVSAGYAWRPYVGTSWRPYTRGYWAYTPSGRYWVSAEPWGVTFHYGSWSLDPYHGWVWYPGTVFSPAWVTWYWGPTYVGWVPAGYYSHYYGPHGYGHGRLGFGFYGWAGGSWGYYNHWTFCPTRYFGWRSYGSYWRSGTELGRTHHEVPRGLILGSTAHIPRNYLGRPEELAELAAVRQELEANAGRKLRDVTEFVARQPTLSSEVREAVFTDSVRRGPAVGSGPARSIDRADAGRITSPVRGAPDERMSRTTRSLPSRPDVSREEIATRAPVRREPVDRTSTPIQPSVRSVPVDGRPSEDRSPRSIESPAIRQVPGADQRAPERLDTRAPMRAMPPSAAGPSRSRDSGVPVVRRILDNIRGSQPVAPSPPSATPSAPSRVTTPVAPSAPSRVTTPAAPSAPSRVTTPATPPKPTTSSPPSRGSSPPPSVRRPTSPPPKVSRPSSGSSMRSSSQAISRKGSSSSKSDRSSGSTRSQSRPKSKPPGR